MVLSIGLSCLTSCKTPLRSEINATVWLNNSPLPADLCGPKEAKAPLWDYGFYRRLNSGGLEFISFCDASSNLWIGIHKDDFNRLLDKYVPENK